MDRALNRRAIADWAPGAAFWLIWQMTNAAGTSQGMAIDDLTFSASSQPAIGPVSLSISRASAGSVLIAWPEADAGFTLEGNADLKLPNGWAPVGPIVIMNGFNTVTVPASSGKQFFRLRQ